LTSEIGGLHRRTFRRLTSPCWKCWGSEAHRATLRCTWKDYGRWKRWACVAGRSKCDTEWPGFLLGGRSTKPDSTSTTCSWMSFGCQSSPPGCLVLCLHLGHLLKSHSPSGVHHIQGGPKMAPFLYALTLPNINRISKLFHCQYQEKICNNTITKDPTTPQA